MVKIIKIILALGFNFKTLLLLRCDLNLHYLFFSNTESKF